MPTVLDRVRDYAAAEPSFTIGFAAWELKVSPGSVWLAVVSLLKCGELREIEPKSGPYGAVYEYMPAEPTPLRVAPDPERDAALRRTVCDALTTGPKSVARIARDLQLAKPRVRVLLDGLITDGTIEKIGQTKGMRYGIASTAAAPAQAAVALRVVTAGTPERELDDREVAYTTEAGPRAALG